MGYRTPFTQSFCWSGGGWDECWRCCPAWLGVFTVIRWVGCCSPDTELRVWDAPQLVRARTGEPWPSLALSTAAARGGGGTGSGFCNQDCCALALPLARERGRWSAARGCGACGAARGCACTSMAALPACSLPASGTVVPRAPPQPLIYSSFHPPNT